MWYIGAQQPNPAFKTLPRGGYNIQEGPAFGKEKEGIGCGGGIRKGGESPIALQARRNESLNTGGNGI